MNTFNTAEHIRKIVSYYAIRITILLTFSILGSCAHRPPTESWKEQYRHLQQPSPQSDKITETDYFIIFLVAAHHLDYWDNRELAYSLINYSRNKENIGHSWVYLKGIKDGKPFVLEGGQSGQLGKTQPRFFKGVMNYIDYGYANPTDAQKKNPRYEPNPIKYLWEDLHDGFFQKESGGHRPTYAAKIDLTEEQFSQILDFMDPARYPYESFSLVGNQCSSFVAEIASMAGVSIEDKVRIKIDPLVVVGKKEYRLWTDPYYSKIIFSTPDMIEKSLMEAVSEGRAEYALGWYLSR